LWTDITKQFLSHSSPAVLAQAVRTILHLLSAHALSNANGEKARDLEDELATQLRDAIGGRDELAMVAFGEDELAALSAACARVAALGARRDLTAWADEDAGGKQSAAWDILAALAERGRLGYKEEERMVQAALQALGMHVLWKAQRVSVRAPGAEDAAFRERLVEQRGVLLDKVTEFALGTRSNTVEAVKQEVRPRSLSLLCSD
jgi:cohesin complex subunit SA-1/2